MATRIPLPGFGTESLAKGVEKGTNLWQQLLGHGLRQGQMYQAQQHHAENLLFRQEQEKRLLEELALKRQDRPLNLDLLKAKIDHQKAMAEKARRGESGVSATRKEQLVKSHQWASLPQTAKENMVAQANALGIRPDVFVKGMTEGKSFEQVAKEQGIPEEEIEKVVPKYLPTTRNVTLENDRKKNLAELDVIERNVSEWMAPYSRKVAGMSLKQIKDALKGENEDDLAKYYAALALQPEMAAVRIKVMGGNMGHAALNELIEANFGKSKVNEALVGPEVYKKMQKYLTQLLHEGSQAATSEIYGRPLKPNKEKKESPYEETQRNNDKKKLRYNRETGKLE